MIIQNIGKAKRVWDWTPDTTATLCDGPAAHMTTTKGMLRNFPYAVISHVFFPMEYFTHEQNFEVRYFPFAVWSLFWYNALTHQRTDAEHTVRQHENKCVNDNNEKLSALMDAAETHLNISNQRLHTNTWRSSFLSPLKKESHFESIYKKRRREYEVTLRLESQARQRCYKRADKQASALKKHTNKRIIGKRRGLGKARNWKQLMLREKETWMRTYGERPSWSVVHVSLDERTTSLLLFIF